MNRGGKQKREAEYKNKAGTAWSHSYLNQKPWHPLSYPNQRRKWIAEQTHSERQRRAEEVAREFSQEQEFFQQSAMLSKKEKEKVEVMQAVGFMYMRPPGYNPESARAAEIADEQKKLEAVVSASGCHIDADAPENVLYDQKKDARVKDIYGKNVATEKEFPILKNAPRMDTGTVARVKPFAVEIRNVKCARCGSYGHQSGDRECPLKDVMSLTEEARQKRDDPLTTIMSHSMLNEPLKWELKQRPGGLSPPHGGFKSDDPNQQILPEDIFDEYGGFLAGEGGVPEVLVSFSHGQSGGHKDKRCKKKKKSRHEHNDNFNDSSKEHKQRKRHHKETTKGTKLKKGSAKRSKRKPRIDRYMQSRASSSSSSESERSEI